MKNHADFAATNGANLIFADSQQILAHEVDGSANHLTRWPRDQAQNGHSTNRLTTAGFTDNRQGFSFFNVIRDVVHGSNNAGRGEELRLQILNFQQLRHLSRSLDLMSSPFKPESNRLRADP